MGKLMKKYVSYRHFNSKDFNNVLEHQLSDLINHCRDDY